MKLLHHTTLLSLFAVKAFGFLLLFSWGYPKLAQGKSQGRLFEIERILFEYGGLSDDLPSFDPIREGELEFGGTIISVDELIEGLEEPLRLQLREIQEISQLPVQYLKSLGYEGLLAFPDPKQIDPFSAKDLRVAGEKSLRILVWVSRLEEVIFENRGLEEGLFERLERIGQADFATTKARGKALKSHQLRFWKRFGGSASRTAVTNLIAGDRPGEVKALVKLRALPRTSGGIHASNAGTATTGKWIIGGSLRHHRLAGPDDELQVSFLSSDTQERQAFNAKYSLPIAYPEVLGFGLQVGFSRYDASSFALTRIDFEGQTKTLDLSLRWKPLELEKANRQWSFEFGLKGERLEAENSLVSGRAEAELLTPRVAAVLQTRSSHGRTLSKMELRRNLDEISPTDRTLLGGVNAVDQATRLNIAHMESLQVGKWLKEKFSVNGLPAEWDSHLLFLRISADLALESGRHLPQHQFIGGGTGSVRGYPESPIAGDSGYSASLEYRIPIPELEVSDEIGQMKGALVPFVDWAETFVNDPLSYESDRSILGAGVGWEMKFSSGLQARLDFAKPLREITTGGTVMEGTGRSDERIHARISWEF